MRPTPSRGNYWRAIVTATSLDKPPAGEISAGIVAKVLPKLDAKSVSAPLSLALNTGWLFIQAAATQGSWNAARQMGLSIKSESEYDAISDRLWRNFVVASETRAHTTVAQFAETAFKRVLNRIIFSTDKRAETEQTQAFLKYVKDQGVEGFARDVLTEYLTELTLTFLRSEDRQQDLNGSLAFHRKSDGWRSYSEEQQFRAALRDSCAKSATRISKSLRHSGFFEIMSSELSDQTLQDLRKRLQDALVKNLTDSGR